MERDLAKREKIRRSFILILMLLAVGFLLFTINSVDAQEQEALRCAEKTTEGAYCIMVPEEECEEGYNCERTSCEATTYCSTGTCENTQTGNCLPATQATCDPDQGGFFYNQPREEVAACQIGCCLLGEEATLAEQSKCDSIGKDYGVIGDFRQDITDEATCLAMAQPEAKGACFSETDVGRECNFETREECQERGWEFREGMLCTAPELNTVCHRTEQTTCVPGRNRVYYVDSCGNRANVYDASKKDDVAYWSYLPGIEGVEIDEGDGVNAGSRNLGSCDYLGGSTCKRYDRTVDGSPPPTYGDYLCRDLRCSANELTGGMERGHGESWCSASIESFENANPGEISHLLYCYEGEVRYESEPGGGIRNMLCYEDSETGRADWVPNRWADCVLAETTRECEDETVRDCKIVDVKASVLRTSYGTEKLLRDSDTGKKIQATCVPRYTPGFKFWDSEGTMTDVPGEVDTPVSMCELANTFCFVPYTQEIRWASQWREDPLGECVEQCRAGGGSRGECREECTPVCFEEFSDQKRTREFKVDVDGEWAESWKTLCTAIGDCGVSANYKGVEGYHRWIELFKPGDNVNIDSILDGRIRR